MVSPSPASRRPEAWSRRGEPMPPAATTTVFARTRKGFPPSRPSTPVASPPSIVTRSTRARVRSSAPRATASSTHSAAFHLAPQRQPSMQRAPQAPGKRGARAGLMNLGWGKNAKPASPAAWARRVEAAPRISAGSGATASSLLRLGRLGVEVDAVARLHPRGRRRRTAAVHARGAPEHQGAHHVQALLGEEEARAVRVQQRPEVGPVVEAPPLVDPALEKQHAAAPPDELAGDGRPAGAGAHHHDVGVQQERHGAPEA